MTIKRISIQQVTLRRKVYSKDSINKLSITVGDQDENKLKFFSKLHIQYRPIMIN